MIETFVKFFAMFAGSTAGVLVVVLPLTAIGYLLFQIYQHILIWRIGRAANRFAKGQIEEEDNQRQEEQPTEGGTAPWV